jgi:hypothetical protein
MVKGIKNYQMNMAKSFFEVLLPFSMYLRSIKISNSCYASVNVTLS